jgi:hypothetical protein
VVEKEKNDKNKQKLDTKNKKTIDGEEKKEIYIYDSELRDAIKKEKAKYRFRVTLLKYWGIQCLTNLRKFAGLIYSKLDDWISLAIKSENEALEKLTNILRSHIESETRIKFELLFNIFDININKDVQNFLEYPPKPNPPKEVVDHSRFNIQQLRTLMEEFESYIIQENYIRTSTFLELIIKKFIASPNTNDNLYGLPIKLKSLSFSNYFKLIKTLDPKNKK